MLTKTIAAAVLIAALLPLGAANAADCVWLHNLDDFKPAQDEKTLVISDGPSHKYNVTFMSRCIGLRFTETIAVRSVGGLFCLTPGDSVSFSNGGVANRCTIDKIEKVSPPPSTDSGNSQPSGY